jgi:hypothetical protein
MFRLGANVVWNLQFLPFDVLIKLLVVLAFEREFAA